jgi:hypothetical protein
MKIRVNTILGFVLVLIGIWSLIRGAGPMGVIPVLIGLALVFLGWKGGRTGNIIFGHLCIVLGCFLITWGIYLLPHSQPTLAHIFFRPLFWGLFSLMGGICANYHGFCRCVRQSALPENTSASS